MCCIISPLLTADDLEVDIGVLGSQKVLSSVTDMTVVFVSPRAWDVIAQVQYQGL